MCLFLEVLNLEVELVHYLLDEGLDVVLVVGTVQERIFYLVLAAEV